MSFVHFYTSSTNDIDTRDNPQNKSIYRPKIACQPSKHDCLTLLVKTFHLHVTTRREFMHLGICRHNEKR